MRFVEYRSKGFVSLVGGVRLSRGKQKGTLEIYINTIYGVPCSLPLFLLGWAQGRDPPADAVDRAAGQVQGRSCG